MSFEKFGEPEVSKNSRSQNQMVFKSRNLNSLKKPEDADEAFPWGAHSESSLSSKSSVSPLRSPSVGSGFSPNLKSQKMEFNSTLIRVQQLSKEPEKNQ